MEKKIDTKRIQKLFSDCSDSGADLRGGGGMGVFFIALWERSENQFGQAKKVDKVSIFFF